MADSLTKDEPYGPPLYLLTSATGLVLSQLVTAGRARRGRPGGLSLKAVVLAADTAFAGAGVVAAAVVLWLFVAGH